MIAGTAVPLTGTVHMAVLAEKPVPGVQSAGMTLQLNPDTLDPLVEITSVNALTGKDLRR